MDLVSGTITPHNWQHSDGRWNLLYIVRPLRSQSPVMAPTLCLLLLLLVASSACTSTSTSTSTSTNTSTSTRLEAGSQCFQTQTRLLCPGGDSAAPQQLGGCGVLIAAITSRCYQIRRS